MSLLMDALKRAEQEKREAARKLEDSTSPPRLEPRPGAEATDQHDIQSQAAAGARLQELSLEPVSGEFENAVTGGHPVAGSAPDSAGSEDVTLNTTGEHLLTMQLNVSQPLPAPVRQSPSGLADQIVPIEEDVGDRTFHGFGAEAPVPVVPGMYEETVRGDMEAPVEVPGYDETLPGVSAAQLAKDIGTRDQPTPVAAETVFAAGRSREDGGGLKWILGGLTVVMLCAAGIWYYLTVTPVARNVPSPWVARGIESLPAVQGESGLSVTSNAEFPGAVPVTDAGTTTPPPVEDIPPGVESASPAEAVAAIPEAAAEPPAAAAPAVESAPAAVDVPPAGIATVPVVPAAAAPSLVRVSRETRVSDQERMVREAYALYQAGDLAGAEAVYQAVLNGAPENLDALLGTGAIALRTGNIARAVQAHGQVLRLDPDNATALAVLVGLNKSVDLNGAESAINLLIKDNPDQPFLHFTLGNIFAAQQRWPEAQQAFFEAHRIDSSNPDYALNLAISLDRIGQNQAALDYYNTALRLAELHSASFDPSAILARIQSLSATATP